MESCIAGDFNGVMDSDKDRTGSGITQGSIPVVFKEWLRLNEIMDTWRYLTEKTETTRFTL